MIRLVVCFLLILSMQNGAIAASFNCNQPVLAAIDSLVCATPKVSALDEHLAITYKQAKESTGSRDSLKEDQLQWLSNVRNKCTDANCLELTYLARIDELNKTKLKVPSADSIEVLRNPSSEDASTAQYIPVPVQTNASESNFSPKPEQFISSEGKETQSKPKSVESNRTSEYAIIAFAGVILLGVVLGFKQTITVFRDYNDLAIVFFSGVLLFWTIVISSSKNSLSDMHLMLGVMLIASVALMIYLIFRTFVDNQYSIWKTPIALITKLTLSTLFLFNLMSLLSPSGKTQSQRARNKANAVIWLMMLTPVIYGLVKNKTGIFMPAGVFNRYQRGKIGIR